MKVAYYTVQISTRRSGAWRPKHRSPMADSTIANEGAEQLAAASKPPRKPRVKKDKSAPPSSEAPVQSQLPEIAEEPVRPPVFQDIQAEYEFSAEEEHAMSSKLRQLLNEIDALTDQKKASAADFALRIQNKNNDAKMIRNKLDSGLETRAVHALVEFDVPRSMKRLLYPEGKVFIREEPMTPADWQLPMFKRDETGAETVAPKGAVDEPHTSTPAPAPTKAAPKPEGDPAANAGTTSVGAKLTQATAGTEAARIELDLTNEDHTHESLLKAFKAAAKKAGWFETQISVIGQQLKLADSVAAMLDILRPHTVKPAPPEEQNPLG